MKKLLKIFVLIILIIALGISGVIWYVKNYSPKIVGELPPGVKDITYYIEGQDFRLINGQAEKSYGNESSTKNILTIFGEPVYGDLNEDGLEDAAVLLVNEPGGSGVLYYAAIAIQNSDGSYQSSNALLIGDRIAPQTVEIRDGLAIYNYAERNPGEPMTTQPSLAQSMYVQYDKATNMISIKPSEAVFCTMEAKLCPDGSYVGRTGPNCEFAPCPGEN